MLIANHAPEAEESLIPYLVVIAGITLLGVAALISWRRKPSDSWLAYAFGFALVLIAGPWFALLKQASIGRDGLSLELYQRDMSQVSLGGEAILEVGLEGVGLAGEGGAKRANSRVISHVPIFFP